MAKATGTFEVTSMGEDTYQELEGGAKLTQANGTQRFDGDIEGEGSVNWLMCYVPGGAARFVGLQRITGSIGKRSGGFVLEAAGEHDGRQSRGTRTVIAGSGTGELSGLSGQGTFEAPGGPISEVAVAKSATAGSYALDIPALTDGGYTLRVTLTVGGKASTATFSGVEVLNGAPAAGAKVDVLLHDVSWDLRRDGLAATVQTGPDGRFEVGPLTPGTYGVAASLADGTVVFGERVELEDGKAVPSLALPTPVALEQRQQLGAAQAPSCGAEAFAVEWAVRPHAQA